MTFKISTGFKKFIVISVTLSGLILIDNRPACAGASNDGVPNERSQHSKVMIVGQSQAPVSTPETNERSSESSESESQPQKGHNSAATEKKPLKDFQPSEKIEADQAVDFPYDI